MFKSTASAAAFVILLALWGCSGSPPEITRPTAEGAAIGTMAGTYLSAQLALGQGVGNGAASTAPLIAAGAVAGGLVGAAVGHWVGENYPTTLPSEPTGPYDLLLPRAHQFDLVAENLSGFTGPGSIVRVREFNIEGSGLEFPSLGLNTEQMPTLELRYWFNQLDAIAASFRYFDIGGNHFQATPILFNGSEIKGGQTLNTNPSEWFSLGLYYERRLTPFYREYESNWPEWLQGWDVRAKAGIEYTYINFEIDSGHAPVTSTSKGEETKEDFYHQAMPVPEIGLEAIRRLGDSFIADGSVFGGWMNRWNSLRDEGGTVWASQNQVEGHVRILYSNPAWLGPVHPMVGMFAYYYSQLEDSHEDGNFIRWFSYGPEYGISLSF